ncbi:PREDICTED: testican-2 [Ficedula albicollis]|uniref:testican-2 n=1 Tax=Ficedula albicollis TaxID=59894 RepID=UPI0007AD936F|nr:PREDICTED: testican-2 [Ficedula albicollis]
MGVHVGARCQRYPGLVARALGTERSGCPTGTECLSPRAGAESRAWGCPRADRGHTPSLSLSLFFFLFFLGAGWAISLPCCQEVEDDYIKSWEDNQPGDEALDTTKDPCQKGSPAGDSKQELCTGQDLADLGDRLRDWFQLLRENAKQNGSGGLPASPATALERSVAATCKEAVGWMFARLDTSGDLFLEAAELAAINLDKYEVCIRAFFNSCDTSKDGRVSAAEWCFCFWREKPPCLRELEKIQIQEATKKKLGEWDAPGPFPAAVPRAAGPG